MRWGWRVPKKRDDFNLMDALNADLDTTREEPRGQEGSGEPRRGPGRKRVGKRSDENYAQVTAYIRRDTHKEVKRALFDEEGDFSDLVQKLLEDWLEAQNPDSNAAR